MYGLVFSACSYSPIAPRWSARVLRHPASVINEEDGIRKMVCFAPKRGEIEMRLGACRIAIQCLAKRLCRRACPSRVQEDIAQVHVQGSLARMAGYGIPGLFLRVFVTA